MKFVKICPKCGSTDVKIPKAGLDIRMTIKDMCVKCGNIGNFPEVDIDAVKDFKKRLKR